MEQSRWRSWVAWLTLLPIIIILGDSYGLWNVINMDADTFTQLFMSIGAFLVGFGIFQNPTDKDHF